MKNIITLSAFLLGLCTLQAQQQAQFTHYMFNKLAYNPAYAGSNGNLEANLLHRSQWVGFDDAPVTQALTVSSSVYKGLGLGLTVINDKIGPTSNTSISGDFAYRLKISDNSFLSAGIKAGISLRSDDLAGIELSDQTDAAFASNMSSELLPNVGFGLYYTFKEKYYAGVAVPQFLENDFTINEIKNVEDLASQTRHYYFMGGGEFDLSDVLTLKPSTLVKLTAGSPLDVDLTALVMFKKMVWAGPMYRLGDAMGIMIGYSYKEMISIGYSFDWSYVNKTGTYNSGSHEVMLTYNMEYKEKKKYRAPKMH